MAGLHTVSVRLHRDSLNTPWGFRVQGGSDFHQPLIIQRVFTGSPAEGELHRGDIITAIENYDATGLLHRDAQEIIKSAGGVINLTIRRSSRGGRSSSVSAPSLSQRQSTTMPRLNKPTWRPSITAPEFGVQYGSVPSNITPSYHSNNYNSLPLQSKPSQVNPKFSTMDIEQARQRSIDDDGVDYAFMNKSVNERRRMFMGPTFQYSNMPVQRPSTRTLKLGSNAPSNFGQRPQEFGWAPSDETLRRARHGPSSNAAFQQESYLPSKDSRTIERDSPPPAWSGSLNKSQASFSRMNSSPERSPRSRNFSTTLRVGSGTVQSDGRSNVFQGHAAVSPKISQATLQPIVSSHKGPQLINKQYNTPINLYSKQNIMESMENKTLANSKASMQMITPQRHQIQLQQPKASSSYLAGPAVQSDDYTSSPLYRQSQQIPRAKSQQSRASWNSNSNSAGYSDQAGVSEF